MIMAINLERHKEAEGLTKHLSLIKETLNLIPFDIAPGLAGDAVIKLIENNPTRCGKHRDRPGDTKGNWKERKGASFAPKGYVTRSTGGFDTAWDHFVEYFFFNSIPCRHGSLKLFIGLGYDSRHWIWTGDLQIPWRVLLSVDGGAKLPKYVDDKLAKNMRDGFTWIYEGQDLEFILIPKKYLKELKKLSYQDNREEYVSKLAEVVFNFLEDLFKN